MSRVIYCSVTGNIASPAFFGVLVGLQRAFDAALPLYFGAGMEASATDQEIVLKDGPERYEGG